MSYKVKEIFYSIQGEAFNTGRPAVFLRFSGCNLWDGREETRKSAICQFCDTDFRGGDTYERAEDLASDVYSHWPIDTPSFVRPLVVCTGGEPLLQMGDALVHELHRFNFEIALETNGTRVVPRYIDWVTVSPKANTRLAITRANELKLVYPQAGAMPEQYKDFYAQHYYLQPMAGPQLTENTQAAIEYCLKNPQWKLSLQTHKMIGIR